MLEPGARLGPYEILGTLGAGGMGEVYRARDTRLNRFVAIKVLPSQVSSTSELRERLEREARAVSSLNHPHICTLHDIGHQDGMDFLVLELIEGETLASRLEKGPLPLPELLQYSIQIADALDRAHRSSIVHRDLKPGNIMVTRSGVKLLDFGLAKLEVDESIPSKGLSRAETVQRDLTKEGTIPGTIPYMAPEQLEGRKADARTDIFAFGAVLYEMATAKRAFQDKSQASLIAAILKEDPKPISQYRSPPAPAGLERLVKICLAKDPEDRWQTAHDIKLELQGILETLSHPDVPKAAMPRRRSVRLAWAIAVICALAAISMAILHFRGSSAPGAAELVQLDLVPPHEDAFFSGSGPAAISPDSKHFVFVDNSDGKRTLYIRALDSAQASPLPGTEHASNPFWSPDSRNVAFFAKGKLMRTSIAGGRPQFLCDVASFARGGSWGAGGTIILADRPNGAIVQIPDSGGVPKPVTELSSGEMSHRFPYFLPDGKHFLYLVYVSMKNQAIYVGSLDSRQTRMLVNSPSRPVYASGYLLYRKAEDLIAQQLDEETLEFRGEPFTVVKNMNSAVSGQMSVSASRSGILTFWNVNLSRFQLSWYDRAGRQLSVAGEMAEFPEVRYLRVSPDNSAAAFLLPNVDSLTPNIWITDLVRNISTRLTSSTHFDESPVWSPDGKTILFNRDSQSAKQTIYRVPASGVGTEEVFLQDGLLLNDWSLDGKYLLGTRTENKNDLWILPLDGDRKPYPFVQNEWNTFQGSFSPDGRWIAYTSDESGDHEIYVQPFPSSGRKWRISTNGGAQARWRRDGKELFYLSSDRRLIAVEITEKNGDLIPGAPQPLFRTLINSPNYPFGTDYDVTSDGQKFLISSTLALDQIRKPIQVIFNWPQLRHGTVRQ